MPVMTSPRESRSIAVDTNKLTYRLLMCHKSKADLEGNGDT